MLRHVDSSKSSDASNATGTVGEGGCELVSAATIEGDMLASSIDVGCGCSVHQLRNSAARRSGLGSAGFTP